LALAVRIKSNISDDQTGICTIGSKIEVYLLILGCLHVLLLKFGCSDTWIRDCNFEELFRHENQPVHQHSSLMARSIYTGTKSDLLTCLKGFSENHSEYLQPAA